MVFIILNGKRAQDEAVRSAIAALRKAVQPVEVRVTYEYGDVKRFLQEAARSMRIVSSLAGVTGRSTRW